MRFVIVPLMLVLLNITAVSPTLAAPTTTGEQAFDQGLKAFRAKDYAAALQTFLQARRAGMDTPALRYNLGVVYYRLKRYPEAEQEFGALARDPAWAPVAHYNLGLTAQRLGRSEQAATHFERAYRTSTDPKLRTLAESALARLGRTQRSTSVAASLALGYDSNAVLAPEAEIVGLSEDSDGFLEVLGALNHRLTGTSARGLSLHGGVVARDYLEIDEFDQIAARVGISRDTDTGSWQTGAGGYIDLVYVDGERFERAGTLELQVRRRLGGGRDVRGRYQFSNIEGGSGFEFLDGSQHRLTLDAGVRLQRAGLRAGYQLELNDRADLVRGAEFYSYSPTRHTIFGRADWPTARGWRMSARGEYRYSHYDDPNRIDGGVRLTREEDRYIAALRADRPLTGPWRLFLDYSYSRNDSNLPVYEYARHQLMTGIETTL